MHASSNTGPRSCEAQRTISRLIGFAVAASILLVVCAAAACVALENSAAVTEARAQIVEINTTRADLAETNDGLPESTNALSEADEALARSQDALRAVTTAKSEMPLLLIWLTCSAGIAAVAAVTLYLYFSVVRPFIRLESFAAEVARGNLDTPLAYERSNPFGKFTWAFDNMRTEIKRARAAEAEAIEQNKTTVAALSHDIKTPIASIRAYSEALELGLASDAEERIAYTQTILRKCDEVTAMTDDLFLHALADLDRIVVECTDQPIAETLRTAIMDFDARGDIVVVHADEALVVHDPKRLAQAIANLLANSRKYAPGFPVQVTGTQAQDVYRIEVRDRGPGIPPEDLPFAFDRFYRGSNAGTAPGAGLGLAITRYLIEQMDGKVRLENTEPGLNVIIELRLAP